MNNKFSEIISLSILIESIISYFKEFFVDGNFPLSMLLSLVLGITIAIAYEIDLPKSLGINSKLLFIGNILTGIIISRGSNYIYDILKTLSTLQ